MKLMLGTAVVRGLALALFAVDVSYKQDLLNS